MSQESEMRLIRQKFRLPAKPFYLLPKPTLNQCIAEHPKQKSLGYSKKLGFVEQEGNVYKDGFGAGFTPNELDSWLKAHPEYPRNKVLISSSQYYSDSTWPTLVVEMSDEERNKLGQKRYLALSQKHEEDLLNYKQKLSEWKETRKNLVGQLKNELEVFANLAATTLTPLLRSRQLDGPIEVSAVFEESIPDWVLLAKVGDKAAAQKKAPRSNLHAGFRIRFV